VIGRPSLRDTAFGGPHRLIRQSLQPQDPGKVDARRHPLVDLEANDVRLLSRSDVVGEHALDMAPRAEQIAHVMLRRTDHLLADQAIARVGLLRRQSIELLSQGQSDAMLAAADVEDPQAPERAQLVLGVTEALRNLEGPCPGRADLGNGTSGKHQRCSKRGVELHLAASVPACPGRDRRESPLDPAAALLHQRQMHPQGHRGGSQCYADRVVAARRKGPVQRRAQIVDSACVIG
jgi:hypothetical protein